MSDFLKIHGALLQAYVGGSFGLETAYENIEFKPTAGVPWAAVYILPNQPDVATLGSSGTDEHDGIFQINLNYPTNTGTADIYEKADEIRDFFKAGLSGSFQFQSVTVVNAGRSTGQVVDGWFRVIITIQWFARTSRA